VPLEEPAPTVIPTSNATELSVRGIGLTGDGRARFLAILIDVNRLILVA
jgi:hypothetical protein